MIEAPTLSLETELACAANNLASARAHLLEVLAPLLDRKGRLFYQFHGDLCYVVPAQGVRFAWLTFGWQSEARQSIDAILMDPKVRVLRPEEAGELYGDDVLA